MKRPYISAHKKFTLHKLRPKKMSYHPWVSVELVWLETENIMEQIVLDFPGFFVVFSFII